MQLSSRMSHFGESIFTQLTLIKRDRLSRGLPVYDFSLGTPNIAPAPHILETISREAADPKNYVYAIADLPELQDAVQTWYRQRYGVEIDPRTEVTSLLGSQEGLSHIALAFADEGDTFLVPNPCYPVFADGPVIAGAELYYMPLLEEKDYIIQLSDIPEDVARRAKMMIVSYPNNPTTAMAPDSFYHELIAFAKQYDIVVVHDNAYSDLVYDGKPGGSFLRFPGAKDVGVEFNSLSKTYGMAGARVGFCVGNADVVQAVKNLKSNMDYGMFIPVQKGAIAAITGPQDCVPATRMAYQHRRDLLCQGMTAAGWPMEPCSSTMFMWPKLPAGFTDSAQFAMELIEKTGIIVTPGSAFGTLGEGHVRMALVQNEETILQAVEALRQSGMLHLA